jgi:hypothetical protein
MPVWEIRDDFKLELRGRERAALELQCAYCDGVFVVEKRTWLKWSGTGSMLTRCCPYCFRTQWLPTASAEAAKLGLEVRIG